ncbi:MAG: T9SS type A sorting domain-containing protein [Candidatus Cloacimonetes bacterium]|nr:T9SS type A sorting domain-containing protein [Candidatus Cloacimonadota bacterium]
MTRKMLLILSVATLLGFATSAFAQFAPPTDLTAELQNDINVYLEWQEPAGASNTLRWDSGENTGNAIGLNGNGGVFIVAARFSPTELAPFDGMALSQVEIYANDEAPLVLKVYTGGSWNGATGDSGTEVLSQPLTDLTWESFNLIDLDTPVTIDATEELWFGYEVDDPGDGVYPAGCDPGPCTNYWGNLILNAGSWASLVDLAATLDFNWNLGGFVTNTRGQTFPLTHSFEQAQAPTHTSAFEACGPSGDVQVSTLRNRAVTSYKIYRDDVEIAENADPGVQNYLDEGLDPATYEYHVTAIWEDVNESDPSNIVEIEVLPIVYNPPQNLTAQVNGSNVVLQWEEPGTGGGGEEELIYDNDVSTGAYSYSGYTMASQMSPAGPCQVLTLKFHTTIQAGDNTFNAEMYNWEAGAPGTTLLHTEAVTALDEVWVEVDVTGANLTVDGDFMVGFGSINASTFLSYDGALDNGRSWDFDGAAWVSWNQAYLIRAIVAYPTGVIAELEPEVNRDRPEVETYNVYRDDGAGFNYIGSQTNLFYSDIGVAGGSHDYYVTAVYVGGTESGASNTVNILDVNDNTVPGFTNSLAGNVPNPFNPTTSIAYSVQQAGPVVIEVYNVRGQLVKTLVNETVEAGQHEVVWNGDDNNSQNVASGMYFYKMKTGRYTATKKMILLK